MDDAIERIIACTRKGEVDSPAEWVGRHEAQAGGDVDMDEVQVGGGDAFCVAYTPEVDLDVHYPESQEWGEEIRDVLLDTLYTGSIAGVEFPVRTGCDPIWGDETDLPMFDSELPDGSNTYYMASTTVCVTPEDWLRIQYNMGEHGEVTQDRFAAWLRDVSQDRIAEIRESIQADDQAWPRPFVELDKNGEVRNYQEGRHRGIAAYREGVPYMDVFVFANHDTNRGEPEHEWETPPAFPEKEV